MYVGIEYHWFLQLIIDSWFNNSSYQVILSLKLEFYAK